MDLNIFDAFEFIAITRGFLIEKIFRIFSSRSF